MSDTHETYTEWLDRISAAPFEERAEAIRDKMIESDELDKESIQCFIDSFDYFMKLYKQGKDLDTNVYKIYMQDVKGYKSFSGLQFIRILTMLCFCGFNIKLEQSNINGNK